MSIALKNQFTHHPPHGSQVQRYQEVRAAGLEFAQFLEDDVPDCHERDVAIDKIREAVMWANAAIACNESEDSEK